MKEVMNECKNTYCRKCDRSLMAKISRETGLCGKCYGMRANKNKGKAFSYCTDDPYPDIERNFVMKNPPSFYIGSTPRTDINKRMLLKEQWLANR